MVKNGVPGSKERSVCWMLNVEWRIGPECTTVIPACVEPASADKYDCRRVIVEVDRPAFEVPTTADKLARRSSIERSWDV